MHSPTQCHPFSKTQLNTLHLNYNQPKPQALRTQLRNGKEQRRAEKDKRRHFPATGIASHRRSRQRLPLNALTIHLLQALQTSFITWVPFLQPASGV